MFTLGIYEVSQILHGLSQELTLLEVDALLSVSGLSPTSLGAPHH